ncbi:MAG: signal recognition particle-docking protein FtsY [Microthrixaceae bacterium]|nr:signal recognition particle-docking protein FtsY [Microthrixaceae bacterium]
MEPILVILTVLAVVLIAGTFFFVNRSTGRRGPDLEPPARGGVLTERRSEPDVATPEESAAGGSTAVLDREPSVLEPTVPQPEVVEPEVVEPVRKPSFRDRLAKARATFAGFLGRTRIDEETWDELEEALIRADLGVGPATELLDQLRARVKAEGLETGEQLVEALKSEMKAQLAVSDRSLRLDDGRTNVWLFVGVNGVGKTTTIGKLGKRQVADGHTVVMAAGDTFRAAAAEQLETWAGRAGAEIVRGAEGADPSAIIFDAIEAAAARGADLVLADTAGRLHTKTNLMEELRKVRRVADKDPGHVTEVLLVLDATTGQNGLVQARQFTEATEVTGVVLTKLDGSAKGGIVFAIHQELGIPVKLVGLGETADDLVDFDPEEFVEGLLAV